MTKAEVTALMMGIAEELYADACAHATDEAIEAFVTLTKWMRSRCEHPELTFWALPDELTPGVLCPA